MIPSVRRGAVSSASAAGAGAAARLPDGPKIMRPGGGLQHARYDQRHVLVDLLARVLGDHHRAVFQVADALPDLLARLDDLHGDALARHDHRLEGVGQVVDVDHLDAAKLGDLVQVVVVGNHAPVDLLAQRDELLVHVTALLTCRQTRIRYLDLDLVVGLELVEHIQPAATRGCASACQSCPRLSATPVERTAGLAVASR